MFHGAAPVNYDSNRNGIESRLAEYRVNLVDSGSIARIILDAHLYPITAGALRRAALFWRFQAADLLNKARQGFRVSIHKDEFHCATADFSGQYVPVQLRHG